MTARRRLLILGTGFAAYRLLARIDRRAYDVTVVSPRNHFLFTPLLPSTTVGTVEFRTIVEPVRGGRPGARFLLAAAEAIDPAARTVRCRAAVADAVWDEPFDVLVVAVGCVTNTFGVPGVAEYALFLKELADARRVREKLVANLEAASLPGVVDAERDRLLHCVAVGGGPTGVRFAAELYDLLTKDLPRCYPQLAPHVRVTLLDAGKTILSAYDASLREYVARVFFRRGIAVRTDAHVAAVGPAGVRLDGGREIPAGLVLWSAGFGPNPVIAGWSVEKDRAGRVVTDENLRVPGCDGVYAAGDCASPRGQNLPQLAQVADQQGRYLAGVLNGTSRGEPFRWRNRGVSSYIGVGDAVAEGEGHAGAVTGAWAYRQWQAVVWGDLATTRRKVLVPLDRLRAYLFGRDLSKF